MGNRGRMTNDFNWPVTDKLTNGDDAMTHFKIHSFIIITVLSGTSFAQQPPDVVTSDGAANTAMGSSALLNLTVTANAGGSNTAAGDSALLYNTTGSFNTAIGAAALLNNITGSYNTASGESALIYNTSGYANTASGAQALSYNQTGGNNTATGFGALFYNDTKGTGISGNTANGAYAMSNNTSGANNTAVGYSALKGAAYNSNTLMGGGTGSSNTGIGVSALFSFSSGHDNTASGYWALYSNSTGAFNTASGSQALYSNSGAVYNTAVGYQALYTNDSDAAGVANDNTAIGFSALYSNVDGYENTALGAHALSSNSAGGNNTAAGYAALYANAGGNNNTASGYQALYANTTGSNNIAMGYEAGYKLVAGSDNIYIGNEGTTGDNKAIRIGKEGTQKKTFIAGIYSNATVSGLAVVIGSNGELGAVSSSERFKTAIEPMGSNTEKLQQLRPVTFRYKIDPQGTLRYGLIAEEVAKVYPELVVRDKNDRIDGVRYDELAPMLLNEMQREHTQLTAKIDSQAEDIRNLKQQVAKVNELQQRLDAVLQHLKARDELVAQR
jgi:hypothetical protein